MMTCTGPSCFCRYTQQGEQFTWLQETDSNFYHLDKIHIYLFVYLFILQILYETSTKSDTLYINEMIKWVLL